MTIANNEAVFEALRRGDATAYATLFSAYYQRLCRYAMRFVHDEDATEDLVQEIRRRVEFNKKQKSIYEITNRM